MQFWGEHKDSLERIAAEYQVPPEYIVAILGVETKYGRITGRYRVLDALATLAFDYPPRHAYFTKELEQFLILAKENKLDPLTLTGSYAGAMGAPQFMPSSYRHYAVDANNDSQRDLWGDWDDVIASVANYLHQSGWRLGAPVLAEASRGRGHQLRGRAAQPGAQGDRRRPRRARHQDRARRTRRRPRRCCWTPNTRTAPPIASASTTST